MSRGEAIEIDNTRIQGLLRKANPVVNKDGALCPNSVYLARDKPCIFGRASTGVTVQLVSRTTPLMISRKHATLGFRDGSFSITDHNVSIEPRFLSFLLSHTFSLPAKYLIL